MEDMLLVRHLVMKNTPAAAIMDGVMALFARAGQHGPGGTGEDIDEWNRVRQLAGELLKIGMTTKGYVGLAPPEPESFREDWVFRKVVDPAREGDGAMISRVGSADGTFSVVVNMCTLSETNEVLNGSEAAGLSIYSAAGSLARVAEYTVNLQSGGYVLMSHAESGVGLTEKAP